MKIALVGSCPSSRLVAPYDDPEWTIWATSPDNVNKIPRFDAWFEIHGDWGWQNPPKWEHNYLQWVNSLSCDVYVQLKNIFPKGIVYPKEEMVKKFGPYWFTSSFAWMMALAITKEPSEIGLYGVDMAETQEYRNQHGGLIHFAHVAGSSGIKVSTPPECDVLQPPPLYGYSVTTPMGRKLAVREREVRERLRGAQEKKHRLMQELDQEIHHLTGSLDDLDYIRTRWTGEPPEGMYNDA